MIQPGGSGTPSDKLFTGDHFYKPQTATRNTALSVTGENGLDLNNKDLCYPVSLTLKWRRDKKLKH